MPAAKSGLALAARCADSRTAAWFDGVEPIRRHVEPATWLLEDA